MRTLDFSNIPRYQRANGKDGIYWVKSKGCTIPFEYDDCIGQFKVIKVDKLSACNIYLTLEYNNIVHEVHVDSLRKCSVGRFFPRNRKKREQECEFFEGQVIEINNTNIELTKKRYTIHTNRTELGFDYRCLECGHVGYKTVASIRNGHGCVHNLGAHKKLTCK